MKIFNIIIPVCSGALVLAFCISCTKRYLDRKADSSTDFNNMATVQVYNSALNTQRNFVYLDGQRLSGTPMIYTQTTATNANHSGSGLNYSIQSGLHSMIIRDTLLTSLQPVLTFSQNFDARKYYTIFTYDTLNAVKQKTVETEIVIPSDTTARVRFANFVYRKSGVPPNVDIFSKRRNANIFSNIPLTEVTGFIPYESRVSDSLIVREAGSMIALDTAIFNFIPKRSYTLVFRGRYSVNETGGVNYPRVLASFTNY